MTIVNQCKTCKHSGNNNPGKGYCEKICTSASNEWELYTSLTEVMPEVAIPMEKKIDSIYLIRELGRDYCITQGSAHYRTSTIEPIEYAIANNKFEDFAVTSIVKYITRFGETRNKDDLKKVADFAHLLCGIEVANDNTR